MWSAGDSDSGVKKTPGQLDLRGRGRTGPAAPCCVRAGGRHADAHLVHQPGQRRPGDAGREVRRRVRRRLPHRDPDPAQRSRPAARAARAPPRRRRSVDRPDEPRPAVRRRVRQRRLPPARSPTRPTSSRSPTACSRPRSRPPSGTTSSSRRRSGPTRSCSGTASRWPRPPGSTRPPPTSRGTQMIEAAEAQGKRIGVQGRRYEGYMVWINALIASGGGQIIENPELGADATPTVASPAGDTAAEIVGDARPLVRPRPPTCRPPARRRRARCSRATTASFMVNWPYVYAAAKDAVEHGAARPVGRRRHRLGPLPARSTAGEPSAPPLGGINLGHRRLHQAPRRGPGGGQVHHVAARATSQYMIESGNPAARAAAYDDPAVREAFPMADLIRESINDAGPRPITPVLRRRVDVGAAHVAPAGRRRTRRRRPRRPTTTWPRCCSGERLL